MLLGKIGNTTPGISMIPARKMCTFLRPLTLWEDSTNETMVLMAGSEPAVAEQKEEQAEEKLDVPIQSQQPAGPSPEVLGDAMVELGREQREDPALRPIIDWAMRECDLRREERVRFSKFVEKYFMKEGVLCRATQLEEKRYEAVVVPTAKVEKILAYLHNGVAGGHLGAKKLIAKMKPRFFWEGMVVDAKRWCNACKQCRQRKSVQNKNAGVPQQMPQGLVVGQIVAIDIVGPLPITARNNRYIVTIMDTYSRFVAAVPVENISADTVAMALFDGWIAWFGVPNVLLSDRGSQFTSHLMKNLLGLMGVEKLTTSAYHPQTNGKIERFHRYLGTGLTAACQLPTKKDWDLRLQQVIYAFRTTDLESTGMTPHEAVFGSPPRLPTDILWGTAVPLLNYGADHKFNLPLNIRQARERVLKFAEQYDQQRHAAAIKGRKPVEFKPDQYVMLHTPPQPEYDEQGKRIEGGPTKLLLRWSGPWRVLRRGHSPNTWIIEADGEREVNVARLLAYEAFKRSNLPRIIVQAAGGNPQDLRGAEAPAVVVNLTSTHVAALSGEKYGSAGKQALEVKRHNEMRRLKFLRSHIEALRQRLPMMEPEPSWTTSVEAEERARDLADYAALVLEWNSFYDDMLSERDYPEVAIFRPSEVGSMATFPNFLTLRSSFVPRVKGAPAPSVAYPTAATAKRGGEGRENQGSEPPLVLAGKALQVPSDFGGMRNEPWLDDMVPVAQTTRLYKHHGNFASNRSKETDMRTGNHSSLRTAGEGE